MGGNEKVQEEGGDITVTAEKGINEKVEEGQPYGHANRSDERKEEGQPSGHGGKFSYFLH